jgi:hypothetical protein
MERQALLQLVRQGYRERAWHGPNLRGALRGVTAQEAEWQPGPGRPGIWELALHCAYWKHRVVMRVTGERAAFARKGANFPRLPARRDEASWRTDLRLLDEAHSTLEGVISGLDEASLLEVPPGQKLTRLAQVIGIALHDVYHAGQIRLLRRLYAQSRRAGKRRRSGRSA